jgi:hypothetical protein
MPAPTKTTNTIRMPGYIDRWYSFAQRGLISQRDLKTDSHLELPLPKITVRFLSSQEYPRRRYVHRHDPRDQDENIRGSFQAPG